MEPFSHDLKQRNNRGHKREAVSAVLANDIIGVGMRERVPDLPNKFFCTLNC